MPEPDITLEDVYDLCKQILQKLDQPRARPPVYRTSQQAPRPVTLIDSIEVQYRVEFAGLCDRFKLVKAVEVGLDRAIFSEELLKASPHLFLYCVDPWQPYREMLWDRSKERLEAMNRLIPFKDRVGIVDTTLEQAVRSIPGPIEFVYIDGAHDHSSVYRDLQMWWQRLSEYGVMAGHDFDHQHVALAVKQFAAGRVVYRVNEGGRYGDGVHPSWYMFKNEPLTRQREGT